MERFQKSSNFVKGHIPSDNSSGHSYILRSATKKSTFLNKKINNNNSVYLKLANVSRQAVNDTNNSVPEKLISFGNIGRHKVIGRANETRKENMSSFIVGKLNESLLSKNGKNISRANETISSKIRRQQRFSRQNDHHKEPCTSIIDSQEMPCIDNRSTQQGSTNGVRDNDGFVIPFPGGFQKPKPPIYTLGSYTVKLSSAKSLVSELIDSLPSAESFYYIKRFQESLQLKKNQYNEVNGCPTYNRGKAVVADWLATSNNSEFGRRNLHKEDFHDCASSIVSFQKSLPSYRLLNWTVLRGRYPMDIIISGDLWDAQGSKLMEANHDSSRVLSAESNAIRTSCCVYHLYGNFVNHTQSIPAEIAKHFKGGIFPRDWTEVVREWIILTQKQSEQELTHINNENLLQSHKLIGNKRKLDDQYDEERYHQVEEKRTRLQSTFRNVVNMSMVTRSALRKKQSRQSCSFHVTPKSSHLSRVNNRKKTPMPRNKPRPSLDSSDEYT